MGITIKLNGLNAKAKKPNGKKFDEALIKAGLSNSNPIELENSNKKNNKKKAKKELLNQD